MKISISLPDELVADVDRARGDVSRSMFIRRRLEIDWVRSLRISEKSAALERSPKPAVDSEQPREPSAAPVERSYSDLPMRERFAVLKAEADAQDTRKKA